MKLSAEQFTQLVEQAIPFNAHLGLKVEELAEGRAVIRMPFRDEHVGDVLRPALHGGVVAALVDATAGAAAFTQTTAADRVSTIDIRIDYLRPAPKADLVADARVRRMGNRIAVVNVEVRPGDDVTHPVAEGRVVFSVRRNVGVPEGVERLDPQ